MFSEYEKLGFTKIKNSKAWELRSAGASDANLVLSHELTKGRLRIRLISDDHDSGLALDIGSKLRAALESSYPGLLFEYRYSDQAVQLK